MENSQQQGKLSEEGFRRAKELMWEQEQEELRKHKEYLERMIQLALFEGKVDGMKVGEQTDEYIKEIVGRELYAYEKELLRKQQLSHFANSTGVRTSAMRNLIFPYPEPKTPEERREEMRERKNDFRDFASKKGKKRGR